jgi:hypothetical protein
VEQVHTAVEVDCSGRRELGLRSGLVLFRVFILDRRSDVDAGWTPRGRNTVRERPQRLMRSGRVPTF